MAPKRPANDEQPGRFWVYELGGGWRVLAGRTEDDNDLLSATIARPDDWWFHVRGTPGSHVVLRAQAQQEPAKETLKMAASIAAYHSKARRAGLVAVSCTRARYVKKPRGAKPGLVQIEKDTTFKVRPGLPGPAESLGQSD